MNYTSKAPHTRAATAAIALAGLITFGAVGFAHADNDVPTSTPSAQSDTSTSTDPASAPSATDRIGLVSVTQVAADGTTPVEGSVIQLERLSDTAAPTENASDTTTTTPSEPVTTAAESATSSTTDSGSSDSVSGLAFPVGAKFDVVTSKNAVILALPEGVYKLTHLGTANNEQAPNAGDVTIRVVAGRHVAGKLQEQPGTTRGAAPGVSSAAADTSTSASATETAPGE